LQSALDDLAGRDKALRLDAIERIANSGSEASENLLQVILDGELYRWKSENRFVRGEKAGRKFDLYALEDGAALATVGRRYAIVKQVFFGLSLGSILVLAAIGLAITFGVMGVINMAHGELIMLGAYTTWAMQQLLPGQPGAALLLAIPMGFVVSASVGMAMERLAISKLYGRPLETLLLTFGFSLILQQAVRTFISARNVAVSNPSWMSGSLELHPMLSLTLNRVVILFFCLMVFRRGLSTPFWLWCSAASATCGAR